MWWLPSGVRVVGRTVTIDIRLQGIARVLLPVVPGLVRSAYRKNLTGLKAVLEAQPPLPGVK